MVRRMPNYLDMQQYNNNDNNNKEKSNAYDVRQQTPSVQNAAQQQQRTNGRTLQRTKSKKTFW